MLVLMTLSDLERWHTRGQIFRRISLISYHSNCLTKNDHIQQNNVGEDHISRGSQEMFF